MTTTGTSPGGPADLATTGLVGRDKIVAALLGCLHQGKSVLLIGAAGMGKTAILRAVADRARRSRNCRIPIYCGQSFTLKGALKSMAEALLLQEADVPGRADQEPATTVSHHGVGPHHLNSLSIGKLRRLVLPRLRSGRYAVLLDHIGLARGAYATFLEDLAEPWKVPVVAAVRSLDPGETGRMWWVGLTFEQIRVPELHPSEARLLAARSLDQARVALPDREEFIKDAIGQAKGNPRMLTRLCRMAQDPRYQAGGRTDFRLLLLDLKMRDLQDCIDAESRIPLRGPIPLSPR